jgi:hypothetical protein
MAGALGTGMRRQVLDDRDWYRSACYHDYIRPTGSDHCGDSEKQLAARLRLSRSTVHQDATTLCRHFGVNSRGGLLARLIRHGG